MLSSESYHSFVDILCHYSPLPSVGIVDDSFTATPAICTASPVDMELGSNYNGALSDSGPNASAKPKLVDGISHSIADSVVANSTASSAEAPPSRSANAVAVPIVTADAPPVVNAVTSSTSSLGAEITTSDAALSKPPTGSDLMDIEVESIIAKSTQTTATATKIPAYVTEGDCFFQSLKYSDAWIDLVYKWVLFEQSGAPSGVRFKVYFDSTLSYCISCRHFRLQIGQRR